MSLPFVTPLEYSPHAMLKKEYKYICMIIKRVVIL